ncbi:uncharacterized protein LOC131612934 isoform X2 [Vicia villosa]|uniref:uncharacterized protein LOC131612934 isoform X2 n=1 Tax=Vicia villosa TaxID=3911 RepID=UPI00273B0295|nr:uncharacterized protein LOC131612934 isoform X2 [Vicia villosa]
MEAETQRKVKDMVLDILTKSNIEETTEFIVRVAASERLGIDLSDSHSKLFVRNIIESYLISIATGDKPPQVSSEVPPPEEPPQVSTEAVNVIHNEPPQELNKMVGVKRKNDDSEDVICQLSAKRNVTVRDFKGTTLVSIREFYLKDGKQHPTVKGISLSSEQWSTFKNSVPAIEEAITKLEGRIRSEHNGWKNREVSSSVADVPIETVPIEPVSIKPVSTEPVSTEPVSIEPVLIEIVPIEIVRFDGKNYQVWAEQVELLLKQLKINYVLTEPCPNAMLGEDNASAEEISETKAAEKRWVNDDLMCRRNILGLISDSLFKNYASRKMSAKELWKELRRVYLIEEYGTKRSQVKKYIEFQMDDEKAVADQIQELNCIADSILAAGMHIDENFHVSVIISKLPLSWKDFYNKLMCEEHLPFWKLMERITIEEESRNGVKQVGEPPSDNARLHHANKGGIKGADIKPPPGFPRKFEPNGKNKTCYVCGQKGHISKNCWRWQ